MVDVALSAGRLLLALGLVALNGFFVASEFALVRIRSSAAQQLLDEGRPGAKSLNTALDDLDQYLAATQLGITIASLGLGWAGEPAVASLIEPILGAALPAGTTHLIAVAIGFSVITFLHVVFGELAPKTVAIQRAEQLALVIAPPMRVAYFLFRPAIYIFNGAANATTRAFGVPPASETEEVLGEEELRMVLSRSSKAGRIAEDERDMIQRVFELDDIQVQEIMVPRPDVVSVTAETTLEEFQTVIAETGHTRYPVIEVAEENSEEGAEEEVIGFVDVKDVVTADPTDQTAGELARDITMIPETATIDELSRVFQQDQNQMAAVIDEWGSFAGITTVEDITEEIAGEFYDTFDRPETDPSIESIDDTNKTYRVDGSVPIAKLNEKLGTTLEADTVGTIGGIVLDTLGRAPEVGDQTTVAGYTMRVTAVDGARIKTLVVQPAETAETTE